MVLSDVEDNTLEDDNAVLDNILGVPFEMSDDGDDMVRQLEEGLRGLLGSQRNSYPSKVTFPT